MPAMGAITDESCAALQAVHALRVLYNWTQPQPGNDGMKVMLTGGAGDLGTVLTPMLEARAALHGQAVTGVAMHEILGHMHFPGHILSAGARPLYAARSLPTSLNRAP